MLAFALTVQGLYDYNYARLRVRHLQSERGDIEYIYDGQSVLEERNLSGNSLVAHYRYSDRLISLNTGSDEQYYHYSALKTTANLTNQAGDTQVSYRTDVWGEITQQQGSSVNKQIFTGQEHDENTGLIYFGARFYDPNTARFITQDSYLGEYTTAPSLHRYLYAYANPTVYTDPDGHIVMKYGQDAFNQWGEDNLKASEGLMESDSLLDRAVGGLSAVVGGFSKAVGTGFGALNYVENQAILAASRTGLIEESSVDLAGKQTADFYQGISDTASFLGSEQGRAQIGQQLSGHIRKLVDGDASALAGTLGFAAESVAPIKGGSNVAGTATRAVTTATKKATKQIVQQSAQKGVSKLKKSLTAEGSLTNGGNRVSDLASSVATGVKQSAQKSLEQVKKTAKRAKQSAKKVASQVKSTVKSGRLNPLNYRVQHGTLGMNGGSVKFGGRKISPKIKELSEANITDNGVTVLGRFQAPPGQMNYIEKATTGRYKGSSYFYLGDAWTPREGKAANLHFLDIVAGRGDKMIFSTPKNKIPTGTSLDMEVKYLQKNYGYKWVNQWSMQRK